MATAAVSKAAIRGSIPRGCATWEMPKRSRRLPAKQVLVGSSPTSHSIRKTPGFNSPVFRHSKISLAIFLRVTYDLEYPKDLFVKHIFQFAAETLGNLTSVKFDVRRET